MVNMALWIDNFKCDLHETDIVTYITLFTINKTFNLKNICKWERNVKWGCQAQALDNTNTFLGGKLNLSILENGIQS